jgi:hypothetical protein
MQNPGSVRRVKTYSAASGFVYQYTFHELKEIRRGFSRGNEYSYLVSVDRKTMFPVKILVRRDAATKWSKRTSRALSGTEEYAVAKMRLFQAFDEQLHPPGPWPELEVDENNLEALLALLEI